MPVMTSMKRSCTLALATVLAAVASGCGASEPVQSAKTSARGESKTTYPLTVENCGRKLTFERAPQRTVSLDQNSTEILLSLGLQKQVVGTASWTDPILPSLADANRDVPRLADNAPTYEVLLGAKPDFTTASFGRHYKKAGGVASRARLEQTGITSYLSPTDCEGAMSINGGGTRTKQLTVDALYQEIRDLAAIFDVPDRGERLVAKLKARSAAARKGVDLDGRTVLFWFADTRTPYVAGGLGASSLLANLTGMKNVNASAKDDWPAVGWESIVDKDPQIIVLGDLKRDRFPGDRLADKTAFLKTDPLTRELEAVRKKCFISLHGAEMNPSIRYVDGLEKIQDWTRTSRECATSGG